MRDGNSSSRRRHNERHVRVQILHAKVFELLWECVCESVS